MNEHDIAEQAYKNGYEAGKRDAVKHGRWVVYKSDEPYGCKDSKEDWYKCSECGKDALGRCYEDEWYSCPILSDHCPKCGARMDGEDDG